MDHLYTILTPVAQTGKVNAWDANIVLTYLSGNALHKVNTLHKVSALRKGNTYHANIVLHNTPHIMALQGERIPELHRLSWQCLDDTLKLEISMLNRIPVWERTPRS